jgi:hypothetical protein
MEHCVMLRIDVSSLRPSEVRSLLANARARGNVALAEQLEAELAARAAGRSQAAQPIEEPDPEPPFENDDVLPIEVGPPSLDFAFERAARERGRPRRWPLGLIAAGAVAAGGAAAWTLAGAPGLPLDKARPATPVAARVAAPPAPRAMTLRAAVAPSPAPDPVSPVMTPPPPEVGAAAVEAPRARPARLDPCATPPSPADRALCNDLSLNLLDHEMREAYGRAMEAGADPIALRDGQAQWRRARDPVADARTLAELYDRRIRELKAAATAPPP